MERAFRRCPKRLILDHHRTYNGDDIAGTWACTATPSLPGLVPPNDLIILRWRFSKYNAQIGTGPRRPLINLEPREGSLDQGTHPRVTGPRRDRQAGRGQEAG